jgi:AcrR family transcriptional regulator
MRRTRPGGRSARVRAAVLGATAELLAQGGYDALELTDVARMAGVHPTTVYRRWTSKARLVGEALLEQGRPLSRTPDAGSLEGDLEQLLLEGSALLQTPPARALFEVLLAESGSAPDEVREARDRFWRVHVEEARRLVDRARARGELPLDTKPETLIDLVIGPALVRLLLIGRSLERDEARAIVARALKALRG